MSKRIFLNWDEITSKVKSITKDINQIDSITEEYGLIVFTIKYINWAFYITWHWDKVEIIEEKEEKKPKFKVWDYVIWNKKTGFGWDIYIEIHSIHNIDNEFAYNFEKFRENDLRLPTKEELKTYFK